MVLGKGGGFLWNSCIMGTGCYWGKEAVFCGIVVSWERVVLGKGGGFLWNSCIMGKGWYWGKRWY